VVSIVSVGRSERAAAPFDDPLHRFFGQEPPPDGPEEGIGSGVIVSDDGLVLTNNHVVVNSDALWVTLADGRELEADVLGTDTLSDIALLRLRGDLRGLRSLPLGDSSRIRLGDTVLAVGNPFGVGQTLTMGIISAKGRANLGIADYEDFIQTDASINPGNSGGPLVNMAGQVIGINTAILSRTGASIGIGFAIPSNMAREIMQALIENGRVVRGFVGVMIQEIDRDLAQALSLPVDRGVLVSDTAPGGPAARAGLRRGDVIVAVDGEPISSTGQLKNTIAAAGAGAHLKLRLQRDGKTLDVPVTLAELPTPEAEPPRPSEIHGDESMGLELAPLDEAARRRFRVPRDVKGGVLVTGVVPGSVAARAGIRPGDLVLGVGRRSVGSPAEFHRLVAGAGDVVALLVQREGQTVYLALRK
jgi:serine protease Do